MGTVNKVFLIGYTGKDGELRITSRGVPIGSVSLATNRSSRTPQGYVEVTDWHHLKAFGPLGERLSQVRKGNLLSVEAELQYTRWVDRAGVTHFGVDLLVRNFEDLEEARAQTPDPGGSLPPEQE